MSPALVDMVQKRKEEMRYDTDKHIAQLEYLLEICLTNGIKFNFDNWDSFKDLYESDAMVGYCNNEKTRCIYCFFGDICGLVMRKEENWHQI